MSGYKARGDLSRYEKARIEAELIFRSAFKLYTAQGQFFYFLKYLSSRTFTRVYWVCVLSSNTRRSQSEREICVGHYMMRI